MLWWQWIIIGVILLGAEIIVDAGFYLVFLGAAAVAVGLIGLSPLAIPWWGQWLLFSGVSVLAMITFRSYLYTKIRGGVPDLAEGLDGEEVTVVEMIAPGQQGPVEARGTRWVARNIGKTPLEPNSLARVESSAGVMLNVIAMDENS